MIFRMMADVSHFIALAAVFVFGFAAAIVPMYMVDPTHKLATFHGALVQTILGMVGLQDMDMLTAQSAGMVYFALYYFVMVVMRAANPAVFRVAGGQPFRLPSTRNCMKSPGIFPSPALRLRLRRL